MSPSRNPTTFQTFSHRKMISLSRFPPTSWSAPIVQKNPSDFDLNTPDPSNFRVCYQGHNHNLGATMPRLSLTDLVDVVSKAGSPKATKVRQIKNRNDYSPATDFYKPLRDGIISVHQSGKSKSELDSILNGLKDVKKRSAYPEIIEGYRKWWGGKKPEWFSPPTAVYTNSGIDVSINPEIGFLYNDTPHVIKLYLKDDDVNKSKMDLITALMEHCLRQKTSANTRIGVLDVRGSKLYTLGTNSAVQKAIIDAELAYVAALWPNV